MSATTPTTGAEWVALQRRHIYAAQTATVAQAPARLQQAIRTNTSASIWASQHSDDSNVSRINQLARVPVRIAAVEAANVRAGRRATEGGSAAPAKGGSATRAPARAPASSGGGGGTAPPDFGGDLPQEAQGLFSAITQTISGGAENLPELWSPSGVGFFARPSTKLILLMTGVALTGITIAIAVSAKPAPAAKPALASRASKE